MKHFRLTLNGRSFDVRVLGDPLREEVLVEVDGTPLTVSVETLSASAPPEPKAVLPTQEAKAASLQTTSSDSIVAAPLPGIVKSVAIHTGQRVSVGAELLVIEAMKMDNVIRASRDGTVGTIHTAEGRRVAHGEPLLEYAG